MVPFYEFQPSDITIMHLERELSFRQHMHEHIEIIYVFDKGQHINIDGKDYVLNAGDAAIVFPDTVHNYYRLKYRDTEQVFVICRPRLFEGIFPNFAQYKPESPVITDLDDVTKMAFREILSAEDFSEQLAWAILVLSKIMKKIKLQQNKAAPVDNLVEKIILYISKNFKNDITLDVLAKEFSVSKCYISRIFSNTIKMSFTNYISLIRAEYAAGLIRSTDDSITNIYNCSGFSSQSTFNRAFKRIYNMSPRDYKDSIGGLYKYDKHN